VRTGHADAELAGHEAAQQRRRLDHRDALSFGRHDLRVVRLRRRRHHQQVNASQPRYIALIVLYRGKMRRIVAGVHYRP